MGAQLPEIDNHTELCSSAAAPGWVMDDQQESIPAAASQKPGFIRILFVDDDDKLARFVREGLEIEGCGVLRVRTAEEALRFFSQGAFDVILLDLILPGKSGLQLLQAMRATRVDTPVIILSAKSALADRVLGLESGADDYLAKPFALAELLARIRALTRRHFPSRLGALKCADLEINVDLHRATRGGIPLSLTAREFEILACLCRNQGRVITRETLAQEIWKEPNRYTPLDNIINVHMARLRRKVDDVSPLKLLHTIRGLGFILREEAP